MGSEVSPGGVDTVRGVVGVPPQKCLKNHTILAKVDKIWVIVTRQLAVPPAL